MGSIAFVITVSRKALLVKRYKMERVIYLFNLIGILAMMLFLKRILTRASLEVASEISTKKQPFGFISLSLWIPLLCLLLLLNIIQALSKSLPDSPIASN